MIKLPCTATTNTNNSYNVGLADCGSLFVIAHLTVHKEQDQVEYDGGSFKLTRIHIIDVSEEQSGKNKCCDEPLTTPGKVGGSLLAFELKYFIVMFYYIPMFLHSSAE